MASINGTSSTKVAYSYLQSKNKIGGLVSGMDIDSIMEKLMKAESAQMEKLQQQKQKYEWKRDAYREVNTTLTSFQQGLFDNYGKYSSWTAKTANVSSNSSVSVKANPSANGNLSITGSQVAKAASSDILQSAILQQTRITANTQLGTIQGLNSADLNIFGNTFNDSSSVQDVLTTLKDNGYNASVAGGKISVSATDTATPIDDNTKNSLEKLGFSLSFNQKSTPLKVGVGDAQKNATSTTKLSELGIAGNGVIKISIEGEEKEITYTSDDKLSSIFEKIKKETGLTASMQDGAINLSSSDKKSFSVTDSPFVFNDSLNATSSNILYSTEGNGNTLTGSNTIAELLGSISSDDGMFTLRAIKEDGTTKDTTITYKNTDTIDSLISKINSSGSGVTAIFNQGKLSISANNTGARQDGGAEVSLLTTVKDGDNDIANTSGGLELFKALGVEGIPDAISNTTEEIKLADGGTNSKLTVNGITYEQTSNVFNIAGYTITASGNLGNYDENGELTTAGSPVTVSSTTEVDSIITKVKEFVDTYNGLIKDLNTRVNEKKNVGYDPLTDAQKAEMTDSEIEKWEKAAKAGIVKGDTSINSALSSMRSTISTYGSNTGEMLYNIGITTSKTWSENGKLEIDEDKLRKTLEDDPDIVARLFVGDSENGTKGIVTELRTAAQDTVKNIEVAAGRATSTENSYSLGRTIASLDTKITDWKDRLKDIENRYWKQFAAMESAIQKANSQSSIFSQG